MPETPGAPFTAHIGAMLDRAGDDHVRLTIQTGPDHADRWGRIHTGVLTSVMDSVIGIALGRAKAKARVLGTHATIEMSTSFYATAAPGDFIICEGRITQLAEQFAFGEVDARTEPGALIAKARLTFALQGRRD